MPIPSNLDRKLAEIDDLCGRRRLATVQFWEH
jgi:hypothetical protein